MPKPAILSKSARLLVLPLALLSTACGTERPRLALPPAERAAPIDYPAIPAGEATCDGKPCLSDRETGELIAGFAAALDQANAKLLWLRDWIVTAAAKTPRR